MLKAWSNAVTVQITGTTKINGLNELTLASFQEYLYQEAIQWDSQVLADFGSSFKNLVNLEASIIIHKPISIGGIEAQTETQIDFELLYLQSTGKLISALAIDTAHNITIGDATLDLVSIDSILANIPENDRTQIKSLMRTSDERTHVLITEVKRYFNYMTENQISEKIQNKITDIVGEIKQVSSLLDGKHINNVYQCIHYS